MTLDPPDTDRGQDPLVEDHSTNQMELIGKVSAGEGKEAEVVVNQTQGLCSPVEGCESYMSKALGSMPSTTERGGEGGRITANQSRGGSIKGCSNRGATQKSRQVTGLAEAGPRAAVTLS